MPYGIGGRADAKRKVPLGGNYLDEFLPGYSEAVGLAHGEQRRLTKEFIGSNNDLNSQVRAAFAAMNEAQKPTKFDKISQAALAVAGILDMATGNAKKRSLAPEKYQAYRAGRKQDIADRQAGVAEKLKSQLTLEQFSGDIRSKNIQAMLGLAGQDAADLQSRLQLAMKGKELKSDIAYKEAATKKMGQAEEKPSPEDKRQAGQAEVYKAISAQVDKEFGTYDPDKHGGEFGSLSAFTAAKDARFQQLWERHYPLKPKIGVENLLKGHGDTSDDYNPADFLPAQESGGGFFDELLKSIGQDLQKGKLSNFPTFAPDPYHVKTQSGSSQRQQK